MDSKKDFPEIYILIGIIALGVIVRTWGISWSLPYTYHVDEAMFAQKAAKHVSGDLNPKFFHVPSLYPYLVAGTWEIYYFIGKLNGSFKTKAEFIEIYVKNPTVFYILGRLVTLIFSLGTILIVYLIGKKMYNPRVGLIASLFLIFSPEHNKYSHYLMPDSPMLFFLVSSFLFIWLIYVKGERKHYILAGLLAGLAMATKYGGQMLFLPLFLAHLFRLLEKREPLRKIILNLDLVLSVIFFLLAFFVSCPYSILDFKIFWRDFKWQSRHLLQSGHYGSSMAQPALFFYLQYGFKENIGLLSQFLVLGGAFLTFLSRRKKDLLLVSYPLILFLMMGTWKTRAVRYLLPATPFFILIGSFFLDFLLARLSHLLVKAKLSFFSKGKEIFILATVLIFLLFPGVKALRFDYTLTQEDTRTVAKDWINARIPRGTIIALESNDPPLSTGNYRITRRHSLSEVDLEFYARRKVQYLIVSDIMSARFTRFPKEFPGQAAFYNSLDEKAVLIKTFEPKRDEYLLDLHNPTIKIYRLSSYPNFSFPGNFRQFTQSTALIKSEGGEWILKSTIQAEGAIEGDERVKNPYARIIDSEGKELAKLRIFEGEIPFSENLSYSHSLKLSSLPTASKVSLGYEYDLSPWPLGFKPESPLKKEYSLAKKIDERSLLKNRLNFIFFYSSLPGRRGDDYFQIVTLTKTSSSWILSSSIFGGELRWGDDYVLNPFVQITDGEGKEIKKLFIFEGKIGSLEAKKRGPLTKTEVLPFLPETYKVFIGYDYYYDSEFPDLAGGPELLGMIQPSLSQE